MVKNKRPKRRDKHLRPRLNRKPELKRSLDRHQRLLEMREEVLERRRSMLRHIGDAVAWTACRSEPRIIWGLFDSDKDHSMPTGAGAIGHRVVRRRGNASGEYFVVENDLTRCLGIGDLTIVPREARGKHRVYPAELKTHGTPEVGERAHTELHFMVEEGDPTDQEYVAAFAETVGASSATSQTVGQKVREQREEISEGRQAVAKWLSRLAGGVSPPPQDNLEAMKAALNHGMETGLGFTFPERGRIGYAAIRGEGFEMKSADQVDEVMKETGLGPDNKHVIRANTAHILRFEDSSTALSPIPLWSLPQEHRALLLSGDLILEARYDSFVLKEAMEERGIKLERQSGGSHWTFELPNGQTVALDFLGMAELTSRITFEGVSPSVFADQLSQVLLNEENLP